MNENVITPKTVKFFDESDSKNYNYRDGSTKFNLRSHGEMIFINSSETKNLIKSISDNFKKSYVLDKSDKTYKADTKITYLDIDSFYFEDFYCDNDCCLIIVNLNSFSDRIQNLNYGRIIEEIKINFRRVYFIQTIPCIFDIFSLSMSYNLCKKSDKLEKLTDKLLAIQLDNKIFEKIKTNKKNMLLFFKVSQEIKNIHQDNFLTRFNLVLNKVDGQDNTSITPSYLLLERLNDMVNHTKLRSKLYSLYLTKMDDKNFSKNNINHFKFEVLKVTESYDNFYDNYVSLIFHRKIKLDKINYVDIAIDFNSINLPGSDTNKNLIHQIFLFYSSLESLVKDLFDLCKIPNIQLNSILEKFLYIKNFITKNKRKFYYDIYKIIFQDEDQQDYQIIKRELVKLLNNNKKKIDEELLIVVFDLIFISSKFESVIITKIKYDTELNKINNLYEKSYQTLVYFQVIEQNDVGLETKIKIVKKHLSNKLISSEVSLIKDIYKKNSKIESINEIMINKKIKSSVIEFIDFEMQEDSVTETMIDFFVLVVKGFYNSVSEIIKFIVEKINEMFVGIINVIYRLFNSSENDTVSKMFLEIVNVDLVGNRKEMLKCYDSEYSKFIGFSRKRKVLEYNLSLKDLMNFVDIYYDKHDDNLQGEISLRSKFIRASSAGNSFAKFNEIYQNVLLGGKKILIVSYFTENGEQRVLDFMKGKNMRNLSFCNYESKVRNEYDVVVFLEQPENMNDYSFVSKNDLFDAEMFCYTKGVYEDSKVFDDVLIEVGENYKSMMIKVFDGIGKEIGKVL